MRRTTPREKNGLLRGRVVVGGGRGGKGRAVYRQERFVEGGGRGGRGVFSGFGLKAGKTMKSLDTFFCTASELGDVPQANHSIKLFGTVKVGEMGL